MKTTKAPGPKAKKFLKVLATTLIFALLPTLVWAEKGKSDLSQEEILRLGERMYLEGILPSGKPMQAYVSGDIPMEGTSFTCVSCHLRSGIGSFEANVATPPTTGLHLYVERKRFIEGFEHVPSYHKYATYFPPRPAYTDKTLADLITSGQDPTGRSVLKVMPRYDIDDADMAILIAYLKNLSKDLSPGVSKEEIKFATVFEEGVDPAAAESMLVPLEFQVSRKNTQAKTYKTNDRLARMAFNMIGPDLAAKNFSLAKWILRGPPETWRAQLEEYYRAEPVFAVLGGITKGEWEPIHRFCEDRRLPDLFPITDYPVLSDTDWYTIYFSRGVRQEGEAAARHLHAMYDLFSGREIVQVVRDNREGRALASGFADTWAGTGHPPAIEVTLKEGAALTPEMLGEIVARHKPAALVVWDDDTALPALETLSGRTDRPGIILASGSFLGKSIWRIPENLRETLYLTYPYRLPQEEVRFDLAIKSVLVGKPMENFDQTILRRSYIIGEVMNRALVKMRDQYYRDYFLDVIGMMADAIYPLYERMSFGPGQRYTVKGCYIVQLSKGDNPQLERKSEWVTQ